METTSRGNGGHNQDLVAVWQIKLPDGLHKVEFEHGTTSGKRIVRVDGKEARRKSYMFKLVGQEQFSILGVPCTIAIEAAPNMRYQYKLDVNGQTYERYQETTAKSFKIWSLTLDDLRFQITLDAQTLDVRINGELIETSNEFTDYGSQLSFTVGSHGAALRINTLKFDREGLGVLLILDDHELPVQPDP